MDVSTFGGGHVALQQIKVTMRPVPSRPLWTDQPPWGRQAPLPPPMTATHPRRFVIQGTTRDGKVFRPSDWAERLAGAMSSFRPGGHAGGPGAYIGYSPYCVPRVINGVSSVIVDEQLRDVELMAWDFVMNFARDNHLMVLEPENPPPMPPVPEAHPS
jgi:hypothetical protein